jgi:hypothetical protein
LSASTPDLFTVYPHRFDGTTYLSTNGASYAKQSVDLNSAVFSVKCRTGKLFEASATTITGFVNMEENLLWLPDHSPF